LITAHNVFKSYNQLQVLDGISLHVRKGELACIVGASGAGKSTLLQLLGTLDTPDVGEITIDNQPIAALNDKKLAAFRNQKIGFVFQFHHLLPEFTALENVCLPAYIHGTPQAQAQQKAMELLYFLGLKSRAHHKPAQLSGGEAQRTAVARALINAPAVVFADEPSGNLDSKNADELHQLFANLRHETGQTFVIVTHNTQLAALADTVIEIKDGRIKNNHHSS
jgi:lipoprotein-releasing system ATP-binding protein